MEIKTKTMEDSVAIANYFIERANSENSELTLLKLVKLVYIAHGYLLALLDKSFLNPKYDKVEAWKFGPVIPTVYHTFKYNATKPITELGVVCKNENFEFVKPKISDAKAELVLDFVWQRYAKLAVSTLVDMLHMEGTPWKMYYEEGKNVEIPDAATKVYYDAMFKALSGRENG